MILGSDPDGEHQEPTPKAVKKRAPRSTYELADLFMYHPKSLMSRSYTQRDRVILMSTMKKLTENGVTRSTISRMINRFWTHPSFPSYSNHIEAFASRAVQKTLMEDVVIRVEDTNPVLNLMANDFERGDVELPWNPSADQQLAKVVMMRCMDACYRYPEVVADIARLWDGNFDDAEFLATIDALNSLVRWHASNESIEHDAVFSLLECVSLPSELRSDDPTMLRPPAGTIGEAVYNYRRFGHER